MPSPPTVPTSVHDLRTLVLSRYPAIAIDTAEEERAALLITAVATQVHLPIYDWTITKGLGPVGHPGGLYGSGEPSKALANLAEVSQDALFVLYDFARHLGDPSISRTFRDLLERFSSPARMSTILLVGTGATLPPEIAPHVVTYELTPPTRADYATVVAAVTDSLVATARAKVTLTPADHEAFAAALSGLTVNQARQLLARWPSTAGRWMPMTSAACRRSRRRRCATTACSSSSRRRTTRRSSAASAGCATGSTARRCRGPRRRPR